MARGGARPGAGRPSNAALDEKKTLAQRTMAKCQERLQRELPKLLTMYIDLALQGDKEALKWCVERGMGKAVVAQQGVQDTEIKVVLGSIPRPGRVNERVNEADAGDVEGDPGGEGGVRAAVLEMGEEEGSELEVLGAEGDDAQE